MSNKEISRRSISRVLSACAVRPFLWDRFCNLPHATNPGGGTGMFLLPVAFPWFPISLPRQPAAPIRSCSRWGLPCQFRRRNCGALLPPRFTLTLAAVAGGSGGLFSVALSLGSPPPAVSRHRIPVEPGLSSTQFSTLSSGRPTVWKAPVAPSIGRGQPPDGGRPAGGDGVRRTGDGVRQEAALEGLQHDRQGQARVIADRTQIGRDIADPRHLIRP
jgi:hypothetical protein